MTTLPPHDLEDNPQIYTVYALIDPRDQAVRYIGVTDEVYERMKGHIRCDGTSPRKDAWIQELQREQIVFIMRSLEHLETWEDAVEREYHWIQRFYSEGADLFNKDYELSNPPRPIYTRQFEHKDQAITAILARKSDASVEEIAQEADCTLRTVENWLRKLQPERPILRKIAPIPDRSKEQEVAAILARMPGASVEQVAQEANCNIRTAEKWMKKLQEGV